MVLGGFLSAFWLCRFAGFAGGGFEDRGGWSRPAGSRCGWFFGRFLALVLPLFLRCFAGGCVCLKPFVYWAYA